MTPRNVILPRVNVIPAPFTNPEALTTNSLNDTCLGGKALGDGSKGRTFQLWYARYENGQIKVKPEDSSTDVFSLPVPSAETISMAFDNNMGIVLAWQAGTTSNLYHYQTVISQFATKTITGTTSCKVAIDEPRDYYTTNSDVIFAYTKNNSLYWVQQRDRYETERLVGTTYGKIIRLGMNESNRFQMECG